MHTFPAFKSFVSMAPFTEHGRATGSDLIQVLLSVKEEVYNNLW